MDEMEDLNLAVAVCPQIFPSKNKIATTRCRLSGLMELALKQLHFPKALRHYNENQAIMPLGKEEIRVAGSIRLQTLLPNAQHYPIPNTRRNRCSS
jgi:hypothetical protein